MKILLFFTLLISASFALAQNSDVLSGNLLLLIQDDFENGVATEIYQIHVDKDSMPVSLRFPNGKVPEDIKKIPPGAKVKAHGKKEKEYFLMEKIERLKN